MNIQQVQEDFNSAINFALDEAEGNGITFLRLWREGDWESIERVFPEFEISDSLKHPWAAGK